MSEEVSPTLAYAKPQLSLKLPNDWTLQIIATTAVSFFLIQIKSFHEQNLMVSLLSSFLYLVLLFGMITLHSKKRFSQKRNILLLVTALYPLIASLLEDKRLLLFTPNLAAIVGVLATDSLSELVLAHMSHVFLSYYSLFFSTAPELVQEESIDRIGWKIELFTSLLWIFVFRLLTEKNKVFESKNHSLLQINEELGRKTTEMREAIQDKENFMLSFSHEFKNLLNVLVGNLTLASKTNYAPVSKYLRAASLAAEVMKLMALNVLDAGKHQLLSTVEIKPQRMHVPSLLENIWNLCAEIIATKPKVSAKILLSDHVPHFLRLDPQRMLQIFLNLVTNAVKFTERGSITIKISWEDTKSMKVQKTSTSSLPGTSDNISMPLDPTSFDDYMTREKLDDEKIEIYQTRTLPQHDSGYYEVNLTKREWTENLGHQAQRVGTRGLLKISIQDTGAGMSKAQCEKLFSKFSQVSEDANKRQLGSGLGLWITKQIIEQHHGRIDVDSREGLGTRFDVILPTLVEDSVGSPSIEIPNESSLTGARLLSLTRATLTRGNLSKPNLTKGNLSKPAIPTIGESRANLHISLEEQKWTSTTSLDSPMHHRHSGGWNVENFSQAVFGMKILVVDDDPFNLELMGRFLTDLIGPNKVIFAQNGKEALELIERGELSDVNLALVDKNLGDMSGIRVIEKIKQATYSGSIGYVHCLLVTGDSRQIIARDLKNVDFVDGYLTKPIEFEELEKIIADISP